ncbi:unnamed protein product [Protopolystoma xenopodis]|uniref:Uncharacterized protein n=1 Tax=Protopolystoma xenopodis TaxID=117903 RepID=A0A448WAC3_9PLAT|nr:unnamed protein product [Protopolystoma xenopodis]
MLISGVGSWTWYIPRRFAGIVSHRLVILSTTLQLVKETREAHPLTRRVLTSCGISPSVLGYPPILHPRATQGVVLHSASSF